MIAERALGAAQQKQRCRERGHWHDPKWIREGQSSDDNYAHNYTYDDVDEIAEATTETKRKGFKMVGLPPGRNKSRLGSLQKQLILTAAANADFAGPSGASDHHCHNP
jgi:hypothetical protein